MLSIVGSHLRVSDARRYAYFFHVVNRRGDGAWHRCADPGAIRYVGITDAEFRRRWWQRGSGLGGELGVNQLSLSGIAALRGVILWLSAHCL